MNPPWGVITYGHRANAAEIKPVVLSGFDVAVSRSDSIGYLTRGRAKIAIDFGRTLK